MNNLLKEYIYNIIIENKKNTRKLYVFDFDMTLYDPHNKNWINKTLKEFNKIKNDDLVILCTARENSNEIIRETKNLLKEKNIKFDYYYFKPKSIKMSTQEYKKRVIEILIKNNTNIEEIYFWEDNLKNLNIIKDIKEIKSGKIKYYPKLIKI